MSGGSAANNSWTLLSSEESVAETLRPLAEGTEQNEGNQTSTAGCGENNPPAEGLAVQDDTVSEEKPAELSEASEPTAVTQAPVSSTLEASGSSVHEAGRTEGSPEGPTELSPDSSSDSYTCITSPPDEPPASLPSTETVGRAEFAPDEEKLNEDETLHHHLNGEELHLEGEELHLEGEELHLEGEESEHQRSTDLGKQAETPPDSEAGEKTGEEGEPEVRRRRSLLAALERVGRREEEEEDEDFQVPQREEDSGFSVNKCILGAVILLGLGTIFFSGVFMDLDEESDYGPSELKGAEVAGKQEWLNPEAPPPPVDADSSQLLNKLAEGSQQISVLQAQLQAQKEELKVAKGQAAEGAKERRHWEEVEKENSRLKTELASLPVLQKENERMKKDLESVPALHKELETLRSTVTELKLSSADVKPATSPPTGQSEDSRQAKKPWDDQKDKKKKAKYDTGEKKEWKEKSTWKGEDKKERKDGGKKEWKKEKHEQGTFEKEGKHKKHNDEAKQWKKEKTSRGDEGKPWKNREGKKEWIGKDEKKEWKEEKERKKMKHEKVSEGKQWKGGKDHGEKPKGKDEWKGEKEWKKVKDGYKESGKEKWEKKDWKEKGEKKEWKKESEWRDNKGKGERKHWEGGKNHGKERSGKDERKQWNEQERSKNGKHDKEWKRKDEKEEEWKRGRQKEKKHNGDRKKEKWEKSNKFTGNHVHEEEEEHLYSDGKQLHSHHKPSLDQPEYWQQQKDRLQRNPKPPQPCSSLETCAQTQRLRPVALPEFQAVLQTYLAKAEEAGVDRPKTEELRKLAAEFFKDGVFAHDQMSFQEFVEDVGDILEDMVEGDEEEDSAIEEEMEAFEREVMEKFSIPGEKEERIKSEWRKEAERGRG